MKTHEICLSAKSACALLFFFNPFELLWIYTTVDDSTIWSKVNELT